MLGDANVSRKNYNATIVEKIVGKKKIRINVDEIGEAFITKKFYNKSLCTVGTKLVVQIKQNNDRWLVSKIISIDGELYRPQEPDLMQEENKPKTNKGMSENQILFPGLDQRYVFNNNKGKSRKKILNLYGLDLISEKFLKSWQDSSFVKITEYSEAYEVIPSHPESKFVGDIVAFNFFKGWQGFIFCGSINSLVYVRHDKFRLSGSLAIGAKVEFTVGTDFDNRGDLQFVAKDWMSNVNRGNAPEPAISIEFEEFKKSRPFIESLLSDSKQFLLITSSRVTGKPVFNADDIINYVNKEYPDCQFQVLKWPKFSLDKSKNSAASGTGRFTHPLIANHVSAAVVLFPKDEGGEEE